MSSGVDKMEEEEENTHINSNIRENLQMAERKKGTGRISISNFWKLLDGKSKFIEAMLQHQKSVVTNDRHTDIENRRLFEIQFERAVARKKLDDEIISQEKFDEIANNLQKEVDAINKAVFDRRNS